LIIEKAKVAEDYHTKTWIKLNEAVIAIQNSTPICYCLEELYTAVENMCSYNMAPQLYENLKGAVQIKLLSSSTSPSIVLKF